MHIVITANSSWNISNFRQNLVESLLSDGHRLTVLAPDDGRVDSLVEMGCEYVPLPMSRKGKNPVGGLLLFARFCRFFRRERPDAVLSFTIKNNLFAGLAGRLLSVPVLPNVTGLGTAFLSGRALALIAQALYRLAFRHSPTVFFQNRDDLTLFLRNNLVRKSQAVLLPGSGIDLAKFKPSVRDDVDHGAGPVFLMVARLLADKGVREYAEAAAIVCKTASGAVFRLLGPADPQNHSAIPLSLVRQWEQAGFLDYLGSTDNVRPEIAKADCVVLPSYREGAPRTLIEAAAMGVPVIATNVPGCRAVVEHGQNGYLCEVRDSSSLAAAMKRFAELSLAERRAMGQASRRLAVETFDVAFVVEAYRKALADVSAMS